MARYEIIANNKLRNFIMEILVKAMIILILYHKFLGAACK